MQFFYTLILALIAAMLIMQHADAAAAKPAPKAAAKPAPKKAAPKPAPKKTTPAAKKEEKKGSAFTNPFAKKVEPVKKK